MNLRSNKGFTGADILVSIVVLTIFIPTLFGMVYNVNKTNKYLTRESNAVKIATEILEIAKSIGVQAFDLEGSGSFNNLLETNNYVLQQTDGEEAEYLYEGVDEVHYKVTINLSYPFDEENDLVKQIKVNVEYPIANTTKSIEISTVLKSR